MSLEKMVQCNTLEHTLKHNWQLWYYKPDKSKVWTENQVSLSGFSSVEGFWCVYNYIELSSRLKLGCDYSLFKKDIQPMWEDESNKRGGRWLFSFGKGVSPRRLDEIWLEVMLCLIGERFGEFGDQICGAVINVRPKIDKISVWTADWSDKAAVMQIGRIIKDAIHYRDPVKYEVHSDSQSRHGSTARAKYTI